HASQECYTALINVTVQEPGRGSPFYIHIHRGRYELAQGRGLADHLGCDPQTGFFVPPNIKPCIALLQRGNCTFKEKIPRPACSPQCITGDIIVVMITELWGNDILSYLEKNISVQMTTAIGTQTLQNFSHDFVVVGSISFIKIRYTNAPRAGTNTTRTVKRGGKETDPDFDHWAVCIESYKQNIVRILPCKHVFYKSCVDPWLSEHCTCTMCKLHILKALGIVPNLPVSSPVTTRLAWGHNLEMSLLPQDGEHTPRAREINIT
ncbi:hypothetical protein FD754_008396, partial [Muntiacus muntjak]